MIIYHFAMATDFLHTVSICHTTAAGLLYFMNVCDQWLFCRPPPDDIMAPFYRDGTIHPKTDELVDTGYTNGQIVAIIVALATTAGIAQYIRIRWVSMLSVVDH